MVDDCFSSTQQTLLRDDWAGLELVAQIPMTVLEPFSYSMFITGNLSRHEQD